MEPKLWARMGQEGDAVVSRSEWAPSEEWIEVSTGEADALRSGRKFDIMDNPAFGTVIGQRETPTGMAFVVGEPDAVIVENIIDTRRRIIVPREPPPPTAEELEAARVQAVRAGIHAAYTVDAEIALVNAAIEALAAGAKLSPEYLAYRAAVAQIKKETPNG